MLDKRFIQGMLALVLAASTACTDTPTSPSSLFDGAWTGTIVDADAGTGVVTLSLTQSGAGVAGTWTASFADVTRSRQGTASGTLANGSLALFLSPSSSLACASGVSLTGTLGATMGVSGGEMKGPYTAFTCTGVDSGTLDLLRS